MEGRVTITPEVGRRLRGEAHAKLREEGRQEAARLMALHELTPRGIWERRVDPQRDDEAMCRVEVTPAMLAAAGFAWERNAEENDHGTRFDGLDLEMLFTQIFRAMTLAKEEGFGFDV